jgi:hypothetical protein
MLIRSVNVSSLALGNLSCPVRIWPDQPNLLPNWHSNVNTVKLGYNELGYNEHPVITNKMKSNGWFQSF